MSGTKIQTTGDLRTFLAKTIAEVQCGAVDVTTASRIAKLAEKINESFYAEIKVAKVRAEAGDSMPAMGEMKIG